MRLLSSDFQKYKLAKVAAITKIHKRHTPKKKSIDMANNLILILINYFN